MILKLKSKISIFFLSISLIFNSCIEEPVQFENDFSGNFEALWHIIDTRYCYLGYKNIAWDSIHDVYATKIELIKGNDKVQLFDLFADMLAELRDGHVNLYSDFDISRYDKWYTDSASNFNSSVIRNRYIENGKLRTAGGLQYGKLKGHDIGYVYYGSFSNSFSSANMANVFKSFEDCNALIIDVRDNGGGSLSYSELLASYFFQEETLTGYMCYKTGTGHNDFSKPTEVKTPAHESLRWERPVAILTNRYSYSATNDFVNRIHHAPYAFTVGSWTGGGGGMPLSSELPNGWMVRFSACPMYTVDMQDTECGLAPDYYACTTPEQEADSIDAVLEKAITIIKKGNKPEGNNKH